MLFALVAAAHTAAAISALSVPPRDWTKAPNVSGVVWLTSNWSHGEPGSQSGSDDGAFVQSLGGTDNAAIAAAVWAAATSANNTSGSFGRMTQQTHLSATRAGSLYTEEEE